MYPIIILAGGLATRLHPITETIPKSLIDINGEPFVFHQLRLLKSKGISDVVFCTGFLGEMIKNTVGNGSFFGMSIKYINDGNSLLGTGGAIKQALHLLEDSFFITYGDSYLNCDYIQVQNVYENSHLPAIMTIFRNDDLWDQSNVEYNTEVNRIVSYSKVHKTKEMNYIDYGLSLVNKSIFSDLASKNNFDIADLFEKLSQQGRLGGFEADQRFYEIGSFAGIEELSKYLIKQ